MKNIRETKLTCGLGPSQKELLLLSQPLQLEFSLPCLCPGKNRRMDGDVSKEMIKIVKTVPGNGFLNFRNKKKNQPMRNSIIKDAYLKFDFNEKKKTFYLSRIFC